MGARLGPRLHQGWMRRSSPMIDRHYGHLARDGREHAIRLLDELSAGQRPRWTLVDARGRRNQRPPPAGTTEPSAEQDETRSPLTDSNRRPPPYHFELQLQGAATA